MKNFVRASIALLIVGGLISAVVFGCRRDPPDIKGKDAKNRDKDRPDRRDPFGQVANSFRYQPGTGDDWTRFRDGLTTLHSHFSKPDVVSRLQLSATDRAFLQKDANLSPGELDEVESTSFRAADAHYLDECFLLRDAARLLENSNLDGIGQAHVHFRWVMRNVLLHEQIDDWIPPAFSLRRGHANAVDRALVFVALLRQAKLGACLITTPEPEPRRVLIGVLEPKTANLRLFDPRLALPILNKDGKTIATLKDALADPTLLEPSGIAAAELKTLEARLVCPLFAISPRMKELDERLSPHDSVVLYLSAPSLKEKFSKATDLPVKVWNPAPQGKEIPNSPTRSLWMFLDKKEGGIDTTGRSAAIMRGRAPIANVVVNILFLQRVLPSHAWSVLLENSSSLVQKYDVQPREMLLRGFRDPMIRRQERMRLFWDSRDLAGIGNDPSGEFFGKELPAWVKRVNLEYAGIDVGDPKQKADVLKVMQSIWGEDQFLGMLLDDKEDQTVREKTKHTVTKVMALGIREYFAFEIPRTRASANHEDADRAQVRVEAAGKPNTNAFANAETKWLEAKSAWKNFHLDDVSLQARIDQSVLQIRRIETADLDPRYRLELRMALVESLHLFTQKYFNSKLRLAECLEHTESQGAKSAAAYRAEILREIESVEGKGALKAEVDGLAQVTRQIQDQNIRERYRSRVDLLAGDWSERGTYYWMKQHLQKRGVN